MTSTEERFWAKVKKTDSCWLWTAYLDRDGYGQLRIAGRSTRAHRYSYELHKGPIPDGLVMDHLCRTRACVNPDHLEAVTNRENLMRGDTRAARNVVKTHCPQGHEYTPENTYTYKNMRECRECGRERCRDYKRRRANASVA